VDLSASFSETGTTASTASASYGSMWMSESSVSVTARSGSVSIQFDPTSGNLSISLGEQKTSATQSITETNAPSHLFLTVPAADIVTLLPGQDQDSDGASNAATIGQGSAQLSNNTSAPSNSDNSLQSVVAGLGFPKLLGVQEALDSLSRVARGAHPAGAPLGSSSAIEAPTQAQVAAAPVVAKIGFMQPLSVAMHDLKGHGTTLFKRPDGSTGAMSFEPTNVQA
jgi:hypothetical protein